MSARTEGYRGRTDELAAAERWLAAHAAELPAVLRRNMEPAARAHRGHTVAVRLELADTPDHADRSDPLAWALAAEAASALMCGPQAAAVARAVAPAGAGGGGYRGRATADRTRERRRYAIRTAREAGQLSLGADAYGWLP